MPAGADAQIIVDGLVKRFGDFVAVDGVSFDVARGEIMGFLGPNGAGKRWLPASTWPRIRMRYASASATCRRNFPFTTP